MHISTYRNKIRVSETYLITVKLFIKTTKIDIYSRRLLFLIFIEIAKFNTFKVFDKVDRGLGHEKETFC